jgi:hypothetical protein
MPAQLPAAAPALRASQPARAAPLRRRRAAPLAARAAADAGGAAAPPPPPAASPAGGLERLRASLGASDGLPFLTDASLIAEDVRYDGPLASISGREAYLAAQREWAATLPARLPGWRVEAPQLFPLGERSVRLRYAARFGAPLPPRATERLAEMREQPPPLRADGLVAASLALRSDITLDDFGRVVRHTERITDGFDVAATIARYEFLTARRLGLIPPPLWYYQVLRFTSLEEAAAEAGTDPEDASLQAGFAAMVARNLATGMGIGICIYAALRFTRIALAAAAAAPPQL